ncbi:hypothetical protein VYF65_003101 [Lysinibacillus irui]|uniref:hypothetical protein n=1 Tax=Lysinibacillus irui TaxID=2998077 RepID=UPI003887114D
MGVGGAGFFAWGSRLERYQSKWDVSSVEASILATKSTKDASNNQKSVVGYNKGALQESGIIAEDGAYPLNGYHSDGFWYVRGGVANTAPTQPGAFTQPSGTLEIGDSKIFTVGAASDAEGNLSKYIWEASINGGAFSKVGETTTNSLTYTIPTATSLKMRVKAVDSAGLESAYRESSLYTVQPPQYYYDKFTALENPIYEYDYTWGEELNSFEYTKTGYESFNFDKNTGKIILVGAQVTAISSYGGPTVYVLGGNEGQTLLQYYVPYINTPVMYRIATVTKKVIRTDYSKGSLMQTGITGGATAYPTNGRHTDGYWYVQKSRVNQSIAPPTPFTSPTTGKKFKPSEAATITFGASNAPNLSLYEVDYRYNTKGTWTPLPYNNTLSRSLTITTDKTLKTLELRVRAKDTSNVYSDYVYSEVFEIEHNVAPTVSLTGPGDNTTLYENDSYNIAGTAYDDDKDQSVTVYYQINNEPRKVLATNLSKTQIALSKQLKFKAGKLYDGDTVLTETLAEGVTHKLKVWAVDNENASSVVVERTFYVVPNRAPLLAIDTVVPSGIINADKFKVSGAASDQDANSNLKVNYRINGANPIEIYDGTGGVWEFEVSLAQLKVGENIIVVEVIDNYNAKTSKTIKLNKNKVNTPILQSVARYKVEPPKGSAKGVLFWVQRDEGLDLKAELSMTLKGEQESYEQLTAMNTAPVYEGVLEDEFYYEALEPKDNIILKLTTSRADVTIDNKIYLIMGVLE